MSEIEHRNVSEPQDKPAIAQAAAAFVVGLVLAALVLYFTMIAPRSGERDAALETIAELQDDLARIDGRDAELQETVAALEAEIEEERNRLAALQSENETLQSALDEAHALDAQQAEEIGRLEAELAGLTANIAALESAVDEMLGEQEDLEAHIQSLYSELEDREAELEEMREAYLVAVGEAERLESELDEAHERLNREVSALEERARAAPEQPATATHPNRFLNLLSSFYAARHEGIRADSTQQAQAAWTRAGELLDTIEEEFPERSVERLRQNLESLEAGS